MEEQSMPGVNATRAWVERVNRQTTAADNQARDQEPQNDSAFIKDTIDRITAKLERGEPLDQKDFDALVECVNRSRLAEFGPAANSFLGLLASWLHLKELLGGPFSSGWDYFPNIKGSVRGHIEEVNEPGGWLSLDIGDAQIDITQDTPHADGSDTYAKYVRKVRGKIRIEIHPEAIEAARGKSLVPCTWISVEDLEVRWDYDGLTGFLELHVKAATDVAKIVIIGRPEPASYPPAPSPPPSGPTGPVEPAKYPPAPMPRPTGPTGPVEPAKYPPFRERPSSPPPAGYWPEEPPPQRGM
jgi:hypothetical protein